MSLSNPDNAPLFAERPEWADVQPLEQYEDANPIAPIFYTEEYKDATNYFRAIVKAGEKSPRVMELTEGIIRQNPAHYSAWQYRYETLIALLASSTSDSTPKGTLPLLLTTELILMDELAVQFLKTYQVWHHRRLLVSLTKQPYRELALIKRSLEVDSKNYHTWSYRQWLLSSFYGADENGREQDDDNPRETVEAGEVWDAELDFVDTMLAQDVRNNSAWHHRFFVVFHSGGGAKNEAEKERIIKRELVYAKQSISFAPSNPSAWNYLRGILTHTGRPFVTVEAFVKPYTLAADSASDAEKRDIVDLDNPPPSAEAELPCVQAMEFLADIFETQGASELEKEKTEKAVELWKRLANEYDTIRKKYWEYRIREAHHGKGSRI